jgi:hypothetical protein
MFRSWSEHGGEERILSLFGNQILGVPSAGMSSSAIITVVRVVDECGKNFCLRFDVNWEVLTTTEFTGAYQRTRSRVVTL